MGQWHPTPILLPGKSHGWRSLVGCSPWGHKESDTTERLHFHFHFSLSCIGNGNGTPLQCSCLENPRDGGACCAGVYGVTQSRTWLKWLSSSSSSQKKKRLSVKVKQSSTEGFGIICSNFQVKQASANVTNSKMVRYCSEGKYHMQLENNLRIWFRIFMITGREFDSRLCLGTSEKK